MPFQQGDVVNGCVLGEDTQWHPLSAPAGWTCSGRFSPSAQDGEIEFTVTTL